MILNSLFLLNLSCGVWADAASAASINNTVTILFILKTSSKYTKNQSIFWNFVSIKVN